MKPNELTKNDSSSKPPRTTNPRCAHRSPSGRQCSQPVCYSSPTFCHAHKPPAPAAEQIVAERLTRAAGSLDSPAEVHQALKEIFRALVAGQLSRERAGTLGFLAQMLLRSHREIAFYEKAQLELQAEEDEQERLRQHEFERVARRMVMADKFEEELYATQELQVGPQKAAELAQGRRDRAERLAAEYNANQQAENADAGETKPATGAKTGGGVSPVNQANAGSATKTPEKHRAKGISEEQPPKETKFNTEEVWEKLKQLARVASKADGPRPFEAQSKPDAAATLDKKLEAPANGAGETQRQPPSTSAAIPQAVAASKPKHVARPAPIEPPEPKSPTMTIPPPRFGEITFPPGSILSINGVVQNPPPRRTPPPEKTTGSDARPLAPPSKE
jgi:hypothetical protein